MIDERKTIADSFLMFNSLIFIGLINELIPIIRRILAIQEPTIFPNDIPASFLNPAPKETASSGADVPNPIRTADIIKMGILKYNAVLIVPSTRISDPLTSKIIPIINKGTAKRIDSILNQKSIFV